MDDATDTGDSDEISIVEAGREALRQYREFITGRLGARVALSGVAMTMFAQTAVAAPVVLQSEGGGVSGWCGVPGGAVVLPLGVLLAQGLLFLAGGYKGVSSLMSNDGGGDYGANSGRVGAVVGGLVAVVGILLPRLATWLMTQFNTSAASMGLGCAF